MKKVAIIALVVAAMLLAAQRYMVSTFSEIGMGESQTSPNERFEASAMDMSSENFWGTKSQWFTFEVKEKGTERIVERIVTKPISSPYFGSRSAHQVAFWSEDSSFVDFRFPSTVIRITTEKTKSQPGEIVNASAAAGRSENHLRD